MNTPTAAADGSPLTSTNSAIDMVDAGNALEEQGRTDEAMARYDAAVLADPRCARAHLNRGNILLAVARIDEARAAYQLAIECNPHYAGAHFNLGNLNCRAGNVELSLHNYKAAIDLKPDFADALVAMANALDNLGRTAEAVQNYERALAINPSYAEVHFNLGVLAMSQGRLEEAANSLRRATEIKPDYVQAHHTLATALNGLEQLDAAEASLRRALSIKPESAEMLYDLAMILIMSGKTPEALQLIAPALEREPMRATKAAFVACIARTRFATNDSRVRAPTITGISESWAALIKLIRSALTTAITEPWAAPHELVRAALDLIMLDPRIAVCVRLANGSWPARLPKAALFGAAGCLAALAADPLLSAVLDTTPVTTIEFERFLTCARHALLESASSNEAPDPSDVAALPFYAALARQCFVNEYIFDCHEEERLAVETCRTRVIALLDANAVVQPLLLLAVSAYFPLHNLPGPDRLLAANWPAAVERVLRQQIREPLEEQAFRAGIERLTSIAVGVSEKVRDQYEQNPYPRWVALPKRERPLRFNDELRRTLPFASFEPLLDDSAPEMLIAGCGTGSHSIDSARRFLGARVLAVDLSLSSISYAKRKTQELSVANIEYAQADILMLGGIARTFDIIESVGVLHHMTDPFAGWRMLLSRLRPGGFMHLGFYSELARKDVVKTREFIAARGYGSTPHEIRRFRQDLAAQRLSPDLQWLNETPDFYSTSECRDLLFHVQEHRLTLGEIESFLARSQLQFIGFEVDPGALHNYRARFTDDRSAVDLRNWARFEAENPNTFAGMYQFWIQRPINPITALSEF